MSHPADDTRLRIPEAVLLGHALVARVAEDLGVRVFFIKGPASVLQGLRLPKVSVDVDAFVAPSDTPLLLAGLRKRGWRERAVDPDERAFPRHSTTIDHPSWPCCIDVHFRFPGMDGDPAECFEAMWAETGFLELAGQPVRVPSRPLGISILALHALRAPQALANRQELRYLKEVAQREQLGPPIYRLALKTTSLGAMRPFLAELIPESAAGEWPEASIAWRNRLFAREPGSARILAILQAPLRRKPKMLVGALFPSSAAYLVRDIYTDLSPGGRLRAYSSRWGRFLRSAPRLAHDLAAYRKSRKSRKMDT